MIAAVSKRMWSIVPGAFLFVVQSRYRPRTGFFSFGRPRIITDSGGTLSDQIN
jgi:hypothetical protein